MAKDLGHTLHLKALNAQLLHHFRHTGRNHAEVFAAGNHFCGIDQSGQLFQGFLLPKLVVAVVVEILINAVDGLLLVVAEGLIDLGFLQFDAGMILFAVVRVGDEKRFDTILQMFAFDEMKTLVFNFFHA